MKKGSVTLIGMPGCGKSTIGKKLAQVLKYELIETDALIEERQKRSISEIFAESGEEYFRSLESAIICEISEKKGCVISTGGGIILNPLNIQNLRQNSVIAYLKRSPESILATATFDKRPLLAGSPEKLHKLYRQRRALYEEYCDLVVDCEKSVYEAVKSLLGELAEENFFHGQKRVLKD